MFVLGGEKVVRRIIVLLLLAGGFASIGVAAPHRALPAIGHGAPALACEECDLPLAPEPSDGDPVEIILKALAAQLGDE